MKSILRITLLAALCGAASFACAQKESNILGKWYFNSIRREDEKEPVSRMLMDIVVGKNAFKQFSSDHRFVAYDNDAYSYGTWRWQDDDNILMITDKGNVFKYTISYLNADSMSLFVSHKYVGFIKAHDSLAQDIKPVVRKKPATVKVTAKQIAKKWTLTKIINSPGASEATTMLTGMLKNSWYEFKEDGTYNRKLTSEMKGQWQLDNKGHSLITIDEEGTGTFWDILEVSDKQLVLQILNNEGYRIYSNQ